MKTLIAILFGLALLLFGVARWGQKTATNPDDWGYVFGYLAGAVVLIVDLILVVAYVLYRAFFT